MLIKDANIKYGDKCMANIIVIETENNSRLLENVMKVIKNRTNCQYTHLCVEEKEKDISHLFFPGLNIDLDRYTVERDGQVIPMSYNEFQVLVHLARRPEQIFSKEQLYDAIYGSEKIADPNNAVYCLIRNIRKKLKIHQKDYNYIQTVRGIGYKFVTPEE